MPQSTLCLDCLRMLTPVFEFLFFHTVSVCAFSGSVCIRVSISKFMMRNFYEYPAFYNGLVGYRPSRSEGGRQNQIKETQASWRDSLSDSALDSERTRAEWGHASYRLRAKSPNLIGLPSVPELTCKLDNCFRFACEIFILFKNPTETCFHVSCNIADTFFFWTNTKQKINGNEIERLTEIIRRQTQ